MRSLSRLLRLFAALALSGAAYAADAPPTSQDIQPGVAIPATTKAWKDAGEFSAVSTNGNSRATTTSAKNTFNYAWGKSVLDLIAGALGSSSGHTVTAEQYNASEKIAYTYHNKDYVFESFGWDSNRFAGYYNRYNATAGLGRLLIETKTDTLATEIGPGYVNEERVNAPRNDFASGRAYAKYMHVLSPTSTFSQDAEYIHDFSDRKDYRLNMETALVSSLTTHLSLKASFVWKRVGEPPLNVGKDDTTTSMALVVNY